ncbi:hypothetical protein [Pseudomonas umsongensis]|uniref:hypothetical protein n=1 Tax=Pseudomonas umsongensis TaxID=198618 RepID=UPI003ECDC4C5
MNPAIFGLVNALSPVRCVVEGKMCAKDVFCAVVFPIDELGIGMDSKYLLQAITMM